MSLVSGVSASGVGFLYDLLRYRWLVLVLGGLLALSALAMSVLVPKPRDISGSPVYLFSIPASSERASEEGALSSPLAVAAYRGRVAVTDSGEGKVKTYDYEGKFESEIDLARLAGRKRAAYPTGIAYGRDGALYVVESLSHRVYAFGPDLRLRTRIPSRPSQLQHPLALVLDSDDLYVADAGDSSIKVFSTEGSLSRILVSARSRRQSLSFPNGLAIGAEGNVYVADSNNRKVLAFSRDGRQLFQFDGPLGLPRGIAVDSLDRVHVVDTFGHEVVAFDSSGKRLFSYGSSAGSQAVEMGFPNGISIDSSAGRVFIADRADNRVQVWGWPETE